MYGVTVYNDQVATTLEWIPMRLEVDSWVTLKAMQIRKWARDARAHGKESLESTDLGIQMDPTCWQRRSDEASRSSSLSRLPSVKIAIGSCRRACKRAEAGQLSLRIVLGGLGPSNVYLDYYLVLHHEVGEATRNGRSHRDLIESGTFYPKATYVLATIGRQYR